MLPNMDFGIKQVTLMPGESVLFYTDGVLDARTPTEEQFGGSDWSRYPLPLPHRPRAASKISWLPSIRILLTVCNMMMLHCWRYNEKHNLLPAAHVALRWCYFISNC